MADLTCFRLVAHARAPCPDHLKRRLIEAFPAGSTWEFYGTRPRVSSPPAAARWQERPGTVGRARPGRSLQVDEDGLIWCSVPEHARFNYFNAAEKTAAAWRADAFTVGDLEASGRRRLPLPGGPSRDLVITGGVNVYPAEVENALASTPASPTSPCTTSATPPGASGSARRTWAPPPRPTSTPGPGNDWHRPSAPCAVPEIPRTLTGKILRRSLGS